MNKWFSADYHLNHANIIRYCKRPFKNVEEMNKSIIKNHNARVKEGDMFFHIGDFCFRNSPGGKAGEGGVHKAEHFLGQLNGIKIMLKGNHDGNNSLKTPIEKMVLRYGGKRMNLVHNPIHADSDYEINLVGHVHEKWKFKKLNEKSVMINVGVDVWNFKPVSFEEITKACKRWLHEEGKKNGTIEANKDENLSKREKKEV